jgi:quinol monooxygenase YgiN
MTNVALFVEIKAKPGKEDIVAAFLASAQALVLQEPATTAWFAVRFDTYTFGIFDAFGDEAGREAHLKGRVAEALLGHVDERTADRSSVDTASRRAGRQAARMSLRNSHVLRV